MTLRPDLDLKFRDPAAGPESKRAICCEGFAAEHVRLGSGGGFSFRVPATSHYLAIHDIVRADGEIFVDGLPANQSRDLRNTITFLPRGCAGTGWLVPTERDNSFTALYFEPETLRQELGLRYAAADPRPFLYRRDARLQNSLTKVQDQLTSGDPDRLYVETLCMAAAIEILHAEQPVRGGELSPRQLRAVLDTIEAGLSGTMTIADLAKVTGLSRFHFTRAFKRATGQSPYHYILTQRIARARQILLASDTPIETVAVLVGFASGAQFSRAFHRSTGERPRDFRRKSKA